MAIAETAARKLLHGGGGVAAFSFGLEGLWQLISGFFTHLFAGLAHLLALPFEALWQWIVAAVSGAANAINCGLGSLWHLVAGFFPNLFAALAGAAYHLLVLPLEALWHWLASAAGSITSGIGGLWHLVTDFFPHLFAALALHLEAFWRWAQSAAAAAVPYALGAAAVLLVVALVWFFGAAICAATVRICQALVVAAHHLLFLPLEAVGRWLQSAAVALPYVLSLLAVALVWLCARALCAAAVGVCRALVYTACFLAHGLYFVGAAAARALACRLPPRGQQQEEEAVQRQQDDEEESVLGVVDTTAWGPEEAEVDGGGDVHHAWHIPTKGLDERAIAAIGAVVYDASKEQRGGGDGNNGGGCTVCQAEFRDGEAQLLLPPCGHAFHRGCIDAWLRANDSCPNCRAPIQVHTTGAKSTATAAGARRT